jgi:hypothetical protein
MEIWIPIIGLLIGTFLVILLRLITHIPFPRRKISIGGEENLLELLEEAIKNGIKKEEEIYIVAGRLGHGWIKEDVEKKVKEALNRGVVMKIIFGPNIDKSSCIFKLMSDPDYSGKIELWRVEKRPREHFRILKWARKVWIEPYHPDDYEGPFPVLYSDDHSTVDRAIRMFESEKKTAKRIKKIDELCQYAI